MKSAWVAGCAAAFFSLSAPGAERFLLADQAAYRCEFRASTFTPAAQSNAAVSVAPGGEITVVWDSRRQQTGRYGVYAQRFTPEGVALGGETALSVWGQSHQMLPALGGDSRGHTWVVWQSHGQDGDRGAIIARRFDPQFAGGREILVNQNTAGEQTTPIVAVRPDGAALFAWSTQDACGDPLLAARLFSPDGIPLDDEFPIAPAGQSARYPAATFTPDGSFAIAYARFSDGDPAGICVQRFTGDGARLGQPTLVAGPRPESPIEPVIAAVAGGFIVAWLDAESDGDEYGVLARRLDSDGKPRGDSFVVNTTTAGAQNAAAIAVASDGRFVIAWNSADGDDAGVFAQLFGVDGARLGGEVRLTSASVGAQELRAAAATSRLAFGPAGQLVLAWSGDAGTGDKTSANLTLLSAQPPGSSAAQRGVTAAMTPASPAETAGLAGPHVPPTFDPRDVDDSGDREIRATRGSFGFTAINNTGWTPPDPHMAVGPDHIVVMTNGAIAAFDKLGNLQFQDEIEDSFGFWGGVGATGFVFDPEVLYDELSGRYFAMAAEAYAPPNSSRSYVLIAVSDDSDPNGTWFKYRFDTTVLAGNLFDSPNIGVDDDAVYVTGDGFGLGANYPIFIFDKASLLAGAPPAVSKSLTLPTSTQSAGLPPVMFDSPGALYMIEHKEAATNTSVRLIALTDPLGAPTLTTIDLAVPAYGPPGDALQRGTSARPESFDARFWSCAYRNGSLWATHHTDSRVRVRWYEIAMNGWPFTDMDPTLVQSGQVLPNLLTFTTFSSITVDADGNAALTFARSGRREYLTMATTYRLACDPLGTLRTPLSEQVSTSSETSGRWGDYSSVQPDPLTPGLFWAHHEYRTTGWRTWVAQIVTETCP